MPKTCAKCGRKVSVAGEDHILSRFTGARYCIGKRETRCNQLYSKRKKSSVKEGSGNG